MTYSRVPGRFLVQAPMLCCGTDSAQAHGTAQPPGYGPASGMAVPASRIDGHPGRHAQAPGARVAFCLAVIWPEHQTLLSCGCAATTPDLTPCCHQVPLKAALGATGRSDRLIKINCLTVRLLTKLTTPSLAVH